MSGVYGGLKALIKEHAPNGDYIDCATHSLNLILNETTEHIHEVRKFSIIWIKSMLYLAIA